MIVGFRMPASYATLEALLVGNYKAFTSESELDLALTELEDRGLIGWDRAANRYDAHPIVRSVVWHLTSSHDQKAVYSALYAHFELMETPNWQRVESLTDLTPAIERYNTLIELGRYDAAFNLFRDRLSDATFYRLAAHRERIELLERFFPGGVDHPSLLTLESSQSYVLNSLAWSYQVSGELGLAGRFYRRAADIDQRNHDEHGRQVGLSNFGQALVDSGCLREAEWAFRVALVVNRKLNDAFYEGIILKELGHLLAITAANEPACVALVRSHQMDSQRFDSQGEGIACTYLAERALRLRDTAKAVHWADRAWELAADQRYERDFIRAAMLQGSAALSLGRLDRADERLHHALNRARAVNMVDLELPTLVALAELELKRKDAMQARARLGDVWAAAERGPYPLQQANAYNVLADIALAEGDKPAAIVAASKAYTAAWCDGPPYAYHWGLEKAKAHLKMLGAPEPQLPPFDESKFPPLPNVEINPKDEYWVDPDKLDD
jgi:tetratricopeptide (TPR) repeat protein